MSKVPTNFEEWAYQTGTFEDSQTPEDFAYTARNFFDANKNWITAPYRGVVTGLTHSPLSATATGAGLGALGVFGVSKILDLLGRPSGSGNLPKLLAGGSLLGGSLGYGINTLGKSGAFVGFSSGATEDQIKTKLRSDPNLSSYQETRLMSMVSQLDDDEKNILAELLSTSSGAAVGMLVSRFLLKLGFVGQILFTLAGGFIGNSVLGENNLAPVSRDSYGNVFSN